MPTCYRCLKPMEPGLEESAWGTCAECLAELEAQGLRPRTNQPGVQAQMNAPTQAQKVAAAVDAWANEAGAREQIGRGEEQVAKAVEGWKATNPKEEFGDNKIPIHLWPDTATLLGSLALLHGALKYGRTNWRPTGVKSTTYYSAGRRHLAAWFEGEDLDPDSGLPHLAHALACIAILIDADAAGCLNDDRAYPGGYLKSLAALTPHVARLKKDAEGKPAPKHYSKGDVK